ncbi:CHC2 zinc finger domain-containing protein [Alicyclobacillus shizuokensis]|uniref:CHC2 zinc finger domain-containing protein n=1 Tax=Alicyclobacillus shizuokensis TaxID=392014 RepID=UPI000A6876A9|nr:CHC2 zinc finger domain-containing protein [Alicyclobacillus shizuokensis]
MENDHKHHTTNVREWLETHLGRIRWRGAQGTARCPFHDDERPSLSVNVVKGVWKCHAGCGGGTLETLARRLGIEPPPSRGKRVNKEPTVVYVYTAADGAPLFRVLRYGNGKGKWFIQERWEEGRWVRGRGETPAVPYRLPDVIKTVAEGRPVLIVEGEKDADTLASLAFTATTNPAGALKWPEDDDFNRYFTGADVVILPDNDDVGRRHAEHVARILSLFARRIRVVELPGLPPKGDVTDWLEAGHSVGELLALIDRVDEWKPREDITETTARALLTYWYNGRFSPALLAEDIMRRHHFVFDGRELYVYAGGVYKAGGEAVIERLAQRLLGHQASTHRVRETVEFIRRETWQDAPAFDPDDGLINVSNGLLDWRKGGASSAHA